MEKSKLGPPDISIIAIGNNGTYVSNESWWERNHRNKPQSNSVGSAALIFISGGMFMAMSLGSYRPDPSWCLAALIGSLISALLIKQVYKKSMYIFSSILVTVSGIILLVDSPSMLAYGFNGFATGFIFVPCLILVGEESVREKRGMLAGTLEATSIAVGYLLQMCFNLYDESDITGIMSIIYGFLSLALTLFFFVESPVLYLEKNQEAEAIDCLRRLQRPFTVTHHTYMWLDELKRYVVESKEQYFNENFLKLLPALVKLCVYRGLIALSYSIGASSVLRDLEDWNVVMSLSLRWVATLMTSLFLDKTGRRMPLIISSCILGCFAIGSGAAWRDGLIDWVYPVFAIMAGIFAAPSSAYLTEAFSLSRKAAFIALSFSFEMFIHLIVGLFGYIDPEDFFYVYGSLTLVFFVCTIFCFPETKQTTLREAFEKFKNIIIFSNRPM